MHAVYVSARFSLPRGEAVLPKSLLKRARAVVLGEIVNWRDEDVLKGVTGNSRGLPHLPPLGAALAQRWVGFVCHEVPELGHHLRFDAQHRNGKPLALVGSYRRCLSIIRGLRQARMQLGGRQQQSSKTECMIQSRGNSSHISSSYLYGMIG